MYKEDIIFVSDFFMEDIPQGGAETCNRELVKNLQQKYKVLELQSQKLDETFIDHHRDCLYILGSFYLIPKKSLELLKTLNYIIYEHDHKYLANRNPAAFVDFLAPQEDIKFQDLYEEANLVICQSKFHENIIKKNLSNLENVYNAGCSLWGKQLDEFEAIYEKNKNNPRKGKTAIIKGNNPNKGQDLSEEYCISKNIDYEIIASNSPVELYEKLCEYESLIFFPRTPETFSRVFLEAKLAGCKVITNRLVGALGEDYNWDSREEIISQLKKAEKNLVICIENVILNKKQIAEKNISVKICLKSDPKVSLITSMYNGEEHIDLFLQEIVRQKNFDECEVIFVDCNDEPGYEKTAIQEYQKQFKNLHYHFLSPDPGVYGAWNYGILKSKGRYISNANLDDFRSYEQVAIMSELLDAHDHIDLVYHPFIQTPIEGETFYNTLQRRIYESYDFSTKNMIKCLPGCMPLWRRSLHDKNGMFDESYRYAGDWEFWLRCVRSGSSFMRNKEVLGCYYFNPNGLSTSVSNQEKKHKEEGKVFDMYQDMIR